VEYELLMLFRLKKFLTSKRPPAMGARVHAGQSTEERAPNLLVASKF